MLHFFFFLFLCTNACLAISTAAPPYTDLVGEVGFNIRTVASQAQITTLNPADASAFMGQAHQFKRNWQKDKITVHPLTLFLATAMDLGSKELIALGNKVIKSYESDKSFITQVFGWRWSDKQGNSRELTVYNATNKMAALLTSALEVQEIQPVSRAYLDYRLSGSFADFERLAAVINLHASTYYHPVIEALCGKSLAGGNGGTAGMLNLLNPDTADQMMEFLPLKNLVRLGLVSLENHKSAIRELTRRLTAYITRRPAGIAKNVDIAQARQIDTWLPALLGKDHQELLRVKQDMVQTIRNAISEGRSIFAMPRFLEDSFRPEQLGAAAEEALAPQVESKQLDCAVMKHIKMYRVWGFGDEAKSKKAKQRTALSYAKNYQVFDPLNPLAPVNKLYLIVREGGLADHQVNLDVHFAEKPSLTMVVNYEDATTISSSPALPDSVRHISFVAPYVTAIENRFLIHCSALKAVDLKGLSGVTTIGHSFLYCCYSLQVVDLSPLSSVTTIGHSFLYYCNSLQAVDLSPLGRVTTIGDRFLYGCPALKAVDFSGLSGVTLTRDIFLSNCRALEAVDFSGLNGVTTIGECFLSACYALKAVDFSGLSGVTTIRHKFLSNCRALEAVDFSGPNGVTTIGECFLVNCGSLKDVNLSGLSNVTTIGSYFLSDCRALKDVNLGGLSGVTEIGNAFLWNGAKTPITITGTPAPATWALIQKQIARPITLARA